MVSRATPLRERRWVNTISKSPKETKPRITKYPPISFADLVMDLMRLQIKEVPKAPPKPKRIKDAKTATGKIR